MSKNLVIAIVLFVLIVGGIAWITQKMPAWRSQRNQPGPTEPAAEAELVKFSWPPGQKGPFRAIFEFDEKGEDTFYMLEFPHGGKGHYDFPFRNNTDGALEMELAKVACDCSYAEVCLLERSEWEPIEATFLKTPWAEPKFTQEPTWHKMTNNPEVGFQIPAGGQGLVRIGWEGRKMAGETLKIHITFWVQPVGNKHARQHYPVAVPVGIAPAFTFDPPARRGLVLTPGDEQTLEFTVWSAYLDNFDKVSLNTSDRDPLMKLEMRQLSPSECKDFQKEIRRRAGGGGARFRVRSGAVLKATLYERIGEQQMDLGYFSKSIPLLLDGQPVTDPTPTISGFVRGEIDVGGQEDHAKVQFKTFSSADDTTKIVPIHANPKFKLEYVDHMPRDLKVKLTPNPKGSTASRAAWDLEVTAPAGIRTGPFPDDARIMLRIIGETPRLVRIPVVGTATR